MDDIIDPEDTRYDSDSEEDPTWDYDDEDEPYEDGPLKGKAVQLETMRGNAWCVVADDGVRWAIVVAIGDDERVRVDRDFCQEIKRSNYCGECGQLGCEHDGLDRSEEEDE